MAVLISGFRLLCRLAGLAVCFAGAGSEYLLKGGKRWTLERRSQWLMKWSKIVMRTLNIYVHVQGTSPRGGFVASNHLSYIDILVLASQTPQVFLSKKEVASWPIIGRFTKMAGTLYIDRSSRRDVTRNNEAFGQVIAAGLGMTVFLEGTSSDGTTILPFRSSLLKPAVEGAWPVTPAFLAYECPSPGVVSTDVCWWGDMGFFSHLFRLSRLERVDALVVWGESAQAADDRKELAACLHARVCALKESAQMPIGNYS